MGIGWNHNISEDKVEITFRLPGWISYLRWVVLIGLVVAIPYFFGVEHPLAICQVCPVGALESSLPRKIAGPLLAGESITWSGSLGLKMALLAGFVAAMLFTQRPWCRLCPLGLSFGLFNRFSAVFLKFKPESCTQCKLCHKSCDLVARPEKNFFSTDCTRCLECSQCPPQALDVGSIFQRSGKNSTDSDS